MTDFQQNAKRYKKMMNGMKRRKRLQEFVNGKHHFIKKGIYYCITATFTEWKKQFMFTESFQAERPQTKG